MYSSSYNSGSSRSSSESGLGECRPHSGTLRSTDDHPHVDEVQKLANEEDERAKSQHIRMPSSYERDIKRVHHKSHCEENCVLCDNPISVFATGSCCHSICFVCSSKMRVVCKQMYCAICRCNLDKVYFTPVKINEPSDIPDNANFNEHGISFLNDSSIEHMFNELFVNKCTDCEAVFEDFEKLSQHSMKVHRLLYCTICLDALKLFPYERKHYTHDLYVDHCVKGDRGDGAFTGHPICRFCLRRFFDKDELYRHSIAEHFYCSFCSVEGRITFYRKYDELRDHFRRMHFLCEHEECLALELSSNVFRSEIELQAHILEVHSSGNKHTRRLHRVVPATAIFNAEATSDRAASRQVSHTSHLERSRIDYNRNRTDQRQTISGQSDLAIADDVVSTSSFTGLTNENFPLLSTSESAEVNARIGRSSDMPSGSGSSEYSLRISNWLQARLPEIISNQTPNNDKNNVEDKIVSPKPNETANCAQSISYRKVVGSPLGYSALKVGLGECEFPSLPATGAVSQLPLKQNSPWMPPGRTLGSKQKGTANRDATAGGTSSLPANSLHRKTKKVNDTESCNRLASLLLTSRQLNSTTGSHELPERRKQNLPSADDFPELLTSSEKGIADRHVSSHHKVAAAASNPITDSGVRTLRQAAQRSFKTPHDDSVVIKKTKEKSRKSAKILLSDIHDPTDQSMSPPSANASSKWSGMALNWDRQKQSRAESHSLNPNKANFNVLPSSHSGALVRGEDNFPFPKQSDPPTIAAASTPTVFSNFIPPESYGKRKLMLACKIRDTVGDNEILFRSVNRSYIEYCKGNMGVLEFYNALCDTVGRKKLQDFIYKLIVLLPNVDKQRELYDTVRQLSSPPSRDQRLAIRARSSSDSWCVEPLQTCSTCGQLVDGYNDLTHHRQQHHEASPKLVQNQQNSSNETPVFAGIAE